MVNAARICPSSPQLAANMNGALHRKPTLAASGTALHLSGDQQNSRLYFSPQSSAETPLFRAFRVRHTSQLCQRAHQVISMIKPCLHHISDQSSHLCSLRILLRPPCYLWPVLVPGWWKQVGDFAGHGPAGALPLWYHFHMDGRGQSSSWKEAGGAQVSASLS